MLKKQLSTPIGALIIILFAIIIFAFTFFICGFNKHTSYNYFIPPKATSIEVNEWKNYQNKKHLFEIKYPSSWELSEFSGNVDQIFGINFYDKEKEYYSVNVQVIKNNKNIEDYTEEIAETASVEKIFIEGYPAILIDGHGLLGGSLRVFKDDKIFSISCHYNALEYWEKMIDAFSFLEKDFNIPEIYLMNIRNVDFVNLFKNMCEEVYDFCTFPEIGTVLNYNWNYAEDYPNSWWADASNTSNNILVQSLINNINYVDINGDGEEEAVISIYGGGTGGNNPFQVFKLTNEGSLKEIEVLRDEKDHEGARGHYSFKIKDDLIIENFPIYHQDDPNCCPSLGEKEIKYKWRDGKILPTQKIKNENY